MLPIEAMTAFFVEHVLSTSAGTLDALGSSEVTWADVASLIFLFELSHPRVQLGYGSFQCRDIQMQMSAVPRMLTSFCNFTPEVFQTLFARVQPYLSRPRDVRGHRMQGERVLGPSGHPVGRPHNLSERSRFLLFLGASRGGDEYIRSGGTHRPQPTGC